VPVPSSYDYAILRVVPRVERGEFLNVGAILFCRTRRFLETRVHLDRQRLAALWPELDITAVEERLAMIQLVCAGGPAAGPIGELPQADRFHWLVSPRSTVVQTSPVHSGLCDDPAEALERVLETMVYPVGDRATRRRAAASD
jgi:Protein of unknown function (DUF3037)